MRLTNEKDFRDKLNMFAYKYKKPKKDEEEVLFLDHLTTRHNDKDLGPLYFFEYHPINWKQFTKVIDGMDFDDLVHDCMIWTDEYDDRLYRIFKGLLLEFSQPFLKKILQS